MTEHMVRKQIYILKRHEALLKRLAKQRGLSEAEIIRQALERETQFPAPAGREDKALEKLLAFADERNARFAGQGEPAKWQRDELYAGREARWLKPQNGE